MSVSQILTDYDGQPTSLCIAGGGGGGGVVSVGAGAGLTITGGPTTNPVVNLGFTGVNQLLYGTGLNAGTLLGPGAAGNFLRLSTALNPILEWHPVSATGVISVSANPGGDIFVNNTNLNTPAVAIAFPAGDKGAIPGGNGTINTGSFNPGPTALQQNYILAADNMSAVGFSWKAAAGTAFTGEAPLVEFVDGTLSKIGINFGVGAAGIGQIPVGISDPQGKVGTLTPALTAADDGKVLTASSADVATGGVKWELPALDNLAVGDGLTKTGTSTAPIINLGFVDKGDIISGTGLNAGVVLPIGSVNQILECFPSAPSGLRWVDEPSSSGGPIINRSSAPANTIDGPTKISDTMILVAEETTSYWDAIPNPIPPGAKGDYKVEFATDKITVSSGPGFIDRQFIGLVATINGARCVQVWEKYGGGELGHFYNDNYTKDAFVYSQAGPFLGAGSGYTTKFVFCGQFTHFTDLIGNITEINNIAVVDATTSVIDNLQPGTTGLGGPVSVASGPKVTKVLYYIDGFEQIIVACGCFSAVLTNPITPGYLSFAMLDTLNSTWSSIALSVGADGLGVAFADGSPGIVNDMWGNALAYTQIAIVGNWDQLAITMSPDTFYPAPASFEGFAISNQTVPAPAVNRWLNTPVGAAGIDYGFCVRESTTIPNHLIITGEVGAAQQVILCDFTTNATTAPNTNIPGWANTDAYYNSIASGQVEVTAGGGLVQCDFVMLMEVGKEVSIYYFPAGIVFPYTATALLPIPAGLIPDDTGNALTSYGIAVGLDQTLSVNLLNVSCKTALFGFSPDPHPTGIVFTTAVNFGYKQGNTITTAATFAAPAFQSQSYIASADLKYWIQTGATAPGLTYA